MAEQSGEKSTGASNRNLKQARLPFKVLDIKSALPNNFPKKRKLSPDNLNGESKSLKMEHGMNTENNVNCVNTDSQKHQTVLHNSSEIKKLLSKFDDVTQEDEESLDIIVLENESPGLKVQTEKCESDFKESEDSGSKPTDASAISVKSESDSDSKDKDSELMDTTAASVKSESCGDADSDLKDVSVNVSTCSLETEGDEKSGVSELDKSTCPSMNASNCTLETGGEEKSGVSELDKSTCPSTAPGSENECAATAVAKVEPSKRQSSGRKSLEMKHKAEKVRLRAEKEKQLQEAREAKKREKERKEVERSMAKQKKKQEMEERTKQKQAQKEAQNEEKLKALEEKKTKKMEALQAKMDEKKRKEEEKQRKKEEKQKEEEEKQRKLEEKKKLDNEVSAKSKAVFASFFIKGCSVPQATPTEESCGLFKPFEVTKDMVLASITPHDVVNQFDKENLDGCFHKQDTRRLYLEELQQGLRCPYKRKKPAPKEEESDDVIILDDSKSRESLHRAKLFQFSENVRPPYYGTWRKNSKRVTGRRPFATDTVAFDYEVDSEEEWDEGGPGESLSGTEEEKESEDDYEVDNDFFVPHGYLSADEEKDEDVGIGTAEHQARLKMREHLFQEERKRKFSELKPRIVGCIWTSHDGSVFPENRKELGKTLSPYRAIFLYSIPIPTSSPVKGQSPARESGKGDSSVQRNKRIPEEAMPHLIKLIHGNPNGNAIIQKEFLHYWTLHRQKSGTIASEEEATADRGVSVKAEEGKAEDVSPGTFVYDTGFSKSQLKITLKKISSYVRCPDPNYPKCVWWVHEEIRTKYGCVDLPIPNEWSYVSRNSSEPKRRKKALTLEADVPEKVPAVDLETPTKGGAVESSNSILKFTCKMSPSERFEVNLQAVTNKSETKNPVPSNGPSSSLRKFAFKSSPADSKEEKIDSAARNVETNRIVQECNNKMQKGTGSILKFARKITPIRLGSSVPTQNKTDASQPANKLKNAEADDVIVLD